MEIISKEEFLSRLEKNIIEEYKPFKDKIIKLLQTSNNKRNTVYTGNVSPEVVNIAITELKKQGWTVSYINDRIDGNYLEIS